MRNVIIILLLTIISNTCFAQKHNIVNASIALRQEKLDEAKKYIQNKKINKTIFVKNKIINYIIKIRFKYFRTF